MVIRFNNMQKTDRKGLRTWIEIDRKAIKHNFSVFKSLTKKDTKLMAVIKSNAYGHSLVDFAKEMETLRADFLGVDSIVEGLALRKEGIKSPILVLGYTLPEMVEVAVGNNIALSIASFEALEHINKIEKNFSKELNIHIKVDTGMHRQGFLKEDVAKVVKLLNKKNKVRVEGLFTHFSSAKNPAFPKETMDQVEQFKFWIEEFKKNGLNPMAHAAATGGMMIFPSAHFDMVRVGIGMYGLWPSKEAKSFLDDRVVLKPVLVWKSLISEIKKYKKGTKLGYDLTESLGKDSTVAVIPIGYWHGYPRALSGVGKVLVGKTECKVLGRVSMDMISVDISKAKATKVGDEVIIIGNNPSSPCSMEGISDVLDLSWYETVTRLNPLIKRAYI